MKNFTVKDFNQMFPTDDACLEWLKNYLYPDGILCPLCQKVTKHHKDASRPSYSCDNCGHHVHPTAGTIYHKSPTPLRSWFHAVFLISSTRTGISAMQLKREIGVTYKTAWRMFTQIRKMMAQGSPFLIGQIEADETYVGGKRRGKRGRGAEGKTPVFGLVEREGRAFARIIPDVKAKTLLPIIQERVPSAEQTTIFTDELKSYDRLEKLGYGHESVQHSAKEYVNGAAHVNNVENLWSNIKRGIDGVHHSVSPQHLQSYLDSYVFRFNHRKDATPMFLTVMKQVQK